MSATQIKTMDQVEERASAFPWEQIDHVTAAKSVCLFADDQLFRAGCEHILATADTVALRFIGDAAADRAIDATKAIRPDVVIVSASQLCQQTIDLVTRFHAELPDTGVVLVYGRADLDMVAQIRVLSTSARSGFACVTRDGIASEQHLLQLIDATSDGRIVLDQSVMSHLLSPLNQGNAIVGRLSNREAEVLALMATGLTNPGIADALCLERKTVERHINGIYTKLADQAGDGHPRVNIILAYLRANGLLTS